MNRERRDNLARVLTTIHLDMAADASAFDGKPFNGRTVAEYFGNQGAAIAAVARIVAELLPADDEVDIP